MEWSSKGGDMSFYGETNARVKPIHPDYQKIQDLKHAYTILTHIFSKETCAPRMQKDWTKDNPTLGQCSITAFLIQDIFGGMVYGILRDGGNYHCYNVIDGQIFDLTSEQFHGELLCYENNPEQFREIHFQKQEKKERYEVLKKRLKCYLENQ